MRSRLVPLGIVVAVIVPAPARAETGCGALSLDCVDTGSLGVRLGLESRTVPARLRTMRGTLDGMAFAIDASQPSVVTGPVMAIMWNPARWLYLGADFALLLGPARASDRTIATAPLAIESTMTGWFRIAPVVGVRVPVGSMWVGAELSAGPVNAGGGIGATVMGEPREAGDVSSPWTWRAESRATLLFPLHHGNFELSLGLDRGGGASSASLGLAYSWYRLKGGKKKGH